MLYNSNINVAIDCSCVQKKSPRCSGHGDWILALVTKRAWPKALKSALAKYRLVYTAKF